MKSWLAIIPLSLVASTAHAQQQPLVTGRVHIDGDPEATLEINDADIWHPVCNAPCDRNVPYGLAYRIAGPGIQPSRPFAISPQGAQLSVQAGSQSVRVLGLTLTSLGAAALTASIVFFLATIQYECSDCLDGLANTTTANWGFGTLGGGLAGLVTGIILVSTSRTDVKLWGEPAPYLRRDEMRREKVAPDVAQFPVFAVSF